MTLIVAIIATMFSLAGLTSIYKAIQESNWLWLIGLLPLVLLVVFVAPYQLWKGQRERADQLEIGMKPSLKIVGSVKQKVGQFEQGYAIEIANLGKEDAKKCHGRLLELIFETPKDHISLSETPRNRDLHWSGQVENADYYDIPGGQLATLNVVYSSIIKGNKLVCLAYRSKEEEFRIDHALPKEFGSILALIRVSYEGHDAINLVCRIDPMMIANIGYEAYSPDKPFELKWYGTEMRDLSEYLKSRE